MNDNEKKFTGPAGHRKAHMVIKLIPPKVIRSPQPMEHPVSLLKELQGRWEI